MTIAAAITRHPFRALLQDFFAIAPVASPTRGGRTTPDIAKAQAELIDHIENGYRVADTGQLVRPPAFARAGLKTIVRSGGDC